MDLCRTLLRNSNQHSSFIWVLRAKRMFYSQGVSAPAAQDNGVDIKGSGRADKPWGLSNHRQPGQRFGRYSKSSQVGYGQEYTKNKPQVGDCLLWIQWIPHCIWYEHHSFCVGTLHWLLKLWHKYGVRHWGQGKHLFSWKRMVSASIQGFAEELNAITAQSCLRSSQNDQLPTAVGWFEGWFRYMFRS